MFRLPLLVVSLAAVMSAATADSLRQARELEAAGRKVEARTALKTAVGESPRDATAQFAYAQFLDRYGSPEARGAYGQALDLGLTGDDAQYSARRHALLSLAAGETAAARKSLQAAGATASIGAPAAGDADYGSAPLPGLLNSFQRMAALSTDLDVQQLLPALARNVVTSGYRSIRGESLEKTEYLKLVEQYLSQAKELEQLAGAEQTIVIPECESQETAELLKILGYRLRGECGPEAVLETVNPSRAFLSIDSAFPLADLEDAYRRDEGFRLEYKPTQVPVLFGPEYWMEVSSVKNPSSFIEAFIADPALARLYVAMSKLHRPTAVALKESVAADKLKNYANVLDFFGASFEIKNGAAVIPGGPAAAKLWGDMTGVNPQKGADFFLALIAEDDGWLAAYFDAISRTTGHKRAYFTDATRMERFYTALRGRVTSPGPARPIFRATAELLLLTSRLDFTPQGAPHVPGGVEPWRKLFTEHPHGKYDGKLTKSAAGWKTDEDLIEALFGLSRKMIENEPLQLFLAISNLDHGRSTPLAQPTIDRLMLEFPVFQDQFALLNETELDDETITYYFDVANSIHDINRTSRRADAAGSFQALCALWQILVRQGQITPQQADATLTATISGFAEIKNDADIFAASRDGLLKLLQAGGVTDTSSPQDSILELLAGNPGQDETGVHEQMVVKLRSLFNQQRLVPIKTLFDFADHLERVSRGESFNVAMANRLAADISEVRLPESQLSTQEANVLQNGDWVERHIRNQRSLNLRRSVDSASGAAEALLEIRGELAPIMRDSLVGLVYVYYSPPGAELIRSNPLFVRGHDFIGADEDRAWRAARTQGSGWPNSSGGQLVGSLAGLPYGLNDAEQNFLIPTERQALIWQDLAPQVLLGATAPRWWQVDAADLHFVGLHLRLGEALIADGALDAAWREKAFDLLNTRVEPARRWSAAQALAEGRLADALDLLAPAELFALARTVLAEHPSEAESRGAPFVAPLQEMLSSSGAQERYGRIASTFGQPHPELATSYKPQLLNLPLFPTMMGYSSRVLAESWESTNLYWAALADEGHLAPAELNLRVPEWTKLTLERIFATHLEDWPALLRSMRIVGERSRTIMQSQLNAQLEAAAREPAQ